MTTTQQTRSIIFHNDTHEQLRWTEQDAQECAALNPGATVETKFWGGFYWCRDYIVRVPVTIGG